ncbi:hypothetical protein SHIRM173S_00614 [Streptomyces hirsutus]
MSRRSGILEFAVLGLLRESPMHGYELRKRLNTSLGVFRAFSYGTLYPCLKTLVANGWLIEEPGNTTEDALAAPLTGRRAKIVYRLTADGKEHFEQLLSQTGPDAYEDETFAARFAFFGQTSRDVRMRVLEGRRSRLEERLDCAFLGRLVRLRLRCGSWCSVGVARYLCAARASLAHRRRNCWAPTGHWCGRGWPSALTGTAHDLLAGLRHRGSALAQGSRMGARPRCP